MKSDGSYFLIVTEKDSLLNLLFTLKYSEDFLITSVMDLWIVDLLKYSVAYRFSSKLPAG